MNSCPTFKRYEWHRGPRDTDQHESDKEQKPLVFLYRGLPIKLSMLKHENGKTKQDDKERPINRAPCFHAKLLGCLQTKLIEAY